MTTGDSTSSENSNSRIRVRVAGLFRTGDGKILFVEHRKSGRRQMLLPGGRLNYGETQPDALKREFKEELALEVEIGDSLFVAECIDPAGTRHLLQTVFAVHGVDVSKIKLGGDPAVVGYALLDSDEIKDAPIYPAQNNVLLQILRDETSAAYHNIPWAEI